MKAIPQLNFTDTGSGPVVLLLHGYLASSTYWAGVIPHLSQSHRVIAMDLLGFGKSPKPGCSKYDYDAQIQSIIATLDANGISEPITVAGHSMGALLALRLTRLYPNRIHKALLTNMPVLLDTIDAKEEIYGTNLMYRIGLKPGLHALIWPIFRATMFLKLLPVRVAEGAINRRHYMFQSTGIARVRSMRNVIIAAKIEADLLAVDAKVVLLSGLQDRGRYLSNIAALKLQDNVITHAVAGGHHLPLTKPALVSEFII